MTWNDLERSVLAALHWSNLSTVLSNHSWDLISLVSVKVHDWTESTDRKLWRHHNHSLHTELLYCLHSSTITIAMNSPSHSEITSQNSKSEHSESQVTPVATPMKETKGKNKRCSVGAGRLSLRNQKHVWSILKTTGAVKVHIYCAYTYLQVAQLQRSIRQRGQRSLNCISGLYYLLRITRTA